MKNNATKRAAQSKRDRAGNFAPFVVKMDRLVAEIGRDKALEIICDLDMRTALLVGGGENVKAVAKHYGVPFKRLRDLQAAHIAHNAPDGFLAFWLKENPEPDDD